MNAGMRKPPVIDVSGLPTFAFGPRDALWWGVVSLFAIEATVFALTLVTYFYLRGGAVEWPPPGVRMPHLLATVNLIVLLASVYPMHRANRAALKSDLKPMRTWLFVAMVLSFVALLLRAFELPGMTFRWNHHAYGSIVWTIYGLHTLHLLSSCMENLLFLALLYRGPVEDKHRLDMRLNGLYWYFVVAVWVPLYAVLFWDPGLFRM